MSRDRSRDSLFCDTASLYVVLAVLEFTMLTRLALNLHMPLPSECWDSSKLKSLKQDRTNT